MYVITDNRENTSFVIAGPSEWRSNYFSYVLSEELGTEIKINDKDEERVPFFVTEGVAIRKCEVVYEDIDSIIQKHDGPFLTFNNKDELSTVKASYIGAYKDINSIKNEIKNKISNDRWKKENSFIKIQLGEEEYFVSCSRSTRDALTQKYIAAGEGDVINWKFKHRWANITKSDVFNILRSIDKHIQSQFDQEIEIVSLIDSINDHEELKDLIISRELI